MDRTTLRIQKQLKAKGFSPGQLDGIMGPKTEAAIVAFKRSVGLLARPYIGRITMAKLFDHSSKPPAKTAVPWVNELGKHINLHEKRDYLKLSTWLRSDGATLGDPRVYPWCGDAMQTAIKLTLPSEPWSGKVAINPYLARNWMDFGEQYEWFYGAMVPMWRGTRRGTKGHIATLIGYDPKRDLIRIRGGNQKNRISDTWAARRRVLGYRKPISYKGALPPVPIMNSEGAVISTNEA